MKPFRFTPIYKHTLWGGKRIAQLRGLNNTSENIGESWELSGIKGQESIVKEGEHKGKSLTELLKTMKEKLVGERCWSSNKEYFPLLIKFIDAKETLSIQVHPNDDKAKELKYPCGKTEMWYILDAEPLSEVIIGFKKPINLEQYKKITANESLTNYLQHYPTDKGKSFFVPAGTIHHIGAGNLLVEIQEASDITFRIYDFDRVDKSGKKRELHTSLAEQSINFAHQDQYLCKYEEKANELTPIVNEGLFKVNLISLSKSKRFDYSTLDCFVAWTIIEGKATIIDEEDNETTIVIAGETVLWSANLKALRITPLSKCFKCLETTI